MLVFRALLHLTDRMLFCFVVNSIRNLGRSVFFRDCIHVYRACHCGFSRSPELLFIFTFAYIMYTSEIFFIFTHACKRYDSIISFYLLESISTIRNISECMKEHSAAILAEFEEHRMSNIFV